MGMEVRPSSGWSGRRGGGIFDLTINADGTYVFHLNTTTPVVTTTNTLTFTVTGGPDVDQLFTGPMVRIFDGVLFSGPGNVGFG